MIVTLPPFQPPMEGSLALFQENVNYWDSSHKNISRTMFLSVEQMKATVRIFPSENPVEYLYEIPDEIPD